MSRFEFTDPATGAWFAALPLPEEGAVRIVTGVDGVKVPLDRLEEVVAGQRDMARQASGQTEAPRTVRIHIDPAPKLHETIRNIVRRGPDGMPQ